MEEDIKRTEGIWESQGMSWNTLFLTRIIHHQALLWARAPEADRDDSDPVPVGQNRRDIYSQHMRGTISG